MPDSYILDVFGPYDGNSSDVDIMRDLFCNSEVRSFFRNEDVFFVNRDFRNVANFSEFLTIE